MQKKLNLCLNKKILILACLSVSFIFSSCRTIRNSASMNEPLSAKITWTKKFPLLDANSNPSDLNFLKRADILHENKHTMFFVSCLSDSYRLQITLLNDKQSQILAVLKYDTNTVELKNTNFDMDIQPEDVVALFQWCFCDVSDVAAVLSENGLTFTVETLNEQKIEIRRIYNGKKCLVEISKSESQIQIQNHYKNYSFNMYLES